MTMADDMFSKIDWTMSGEAIERESFRRIESEIGRHNLSETDWRVARRLIHTTGDLSLLGEILFSGNPVEAGLAALRDRAPIYCDSNMIRSGISLERLRKINPNYNADDLLCFVADEAVREKARQEGTARALGALEVAKHRLHGAVALIGNSPLALAGLLRLRLRENIVPRLIIGMPVGFVHVEESKEILAKSDVPYVLIKGRRGGSPLAVAALHGIIESGI